MTNIEMLSQRYMGMNEELLIAIKANNIHEFKQLLNNNHYDFNIEFTKPNSGRLLDICCKLPGKHDFVKELLSKPVEINSLNKAGKTGIHYAAENGNITTLRVLLKSDLTDINVLDDDKNSALHLATKAGHTECSQLLLQNKKIKPNEKNSEGKNPAYIAATSREKDDNLMRLFIKCPNVNLDVIVQEKPKLTLRELIIENYPDLKVDKYDPINYLESKDIERFIWYISFTRQLEHGDGNNATNTYLQYACDNGLREVVKVLLEFGADPNQTTSKNQNNPVFIASFKGFVEIIKLFVENDKPDKPIEFYSPTKGSVIHEVLKGWSKYPNKSDVKNELCNYELSFNELLKLCEIDLTEDKNKIPIIDINCVDTDGYTCLHYAIKSGKKKVVLDLLKHNAYIGKKTENKKPLIDEISYDILESYLNACVNEEKCINKIKLMYKFLCPPMILDNNKKTQNPESQNKKITLEKVKETDPLLYISQNPDLKPLLVHPVISSFIFLKWHRIKVFYYLNFAYYLFFLINLSLFILFYDKYFWKTYAFGWFIVLFSNINMCFREIFQIITYRIKYVMSLQNFMEIFTIILTFCLLFDILNDKLKLQASATVFLISWTQIFFFLGRHPVLTINLEIFKIVSVNFLKFLIWFGILIVAFVLCFYMLFKYEKNSDFWYTLENIASMSFETILMLIGQFDLKNEQFNEYPYSIIGRSLFIMFIFLINIVFINLLSGLAVSDIQEIKHVSKLVAMASNVRFINDFETILHENSLSSFIFFLCVKLCERFKFKCIQKLELFPEALKQPYTLIDSNGNIQNMLINAVFKGIYLDADGITKAISICKFNMEKSECSVHEKFNSIENAMKELKEMLKDMN